MSRTAVTVPLRGAKIPTSHAATNAAESFPAFDFMVVEAEERSPERRIPIASVLARKAATVLPLHARRGCADADAAANDGTQWQDERWDAD
jgi:hypothetical protein